LSTNVKELFSGYLPVLLWAIVIFAFSANPVPYQALPQSWSETLTSATTVTPTATLNAITINEVLGRFLHVGEYFILALLVCRMVVWQDKVTPISNIAVIGLSSIYAISDELHQHYVPGRTLQVSDLLLDIVGILVGVLVFHLII
jgi:VanZ family protein